MSESASHSGSCPFCGTQLSSDAVIIEYDVDGETRAFVDCPRCDEPVQPQ